MRCVGKNYFDKLQGGSSIELCIKYFAMRSDRESHKNINKTDKARKLEKKVKKEQRSLSGKYENIKKKRGETATKRANINKNILRVQKVHARLANVRLEYESLLFIEW